MSSENAQFGQHEHGQNVSDLISPIENIQFLRLKIIAPGVGTIWVGNVGRGPRWPGRLEKTIANIQLYPASTLPCIVYNIVPHYA